MAETDSTEPTWSRPPYDFSERFDRWLLSDKVKFVFDVDDYPSGAAAMRISERRQQKYVAIGLADADTYRLYGNWSYARPVHRVIVTYFICTTIFSLAFGGILFIYSIALSISLFVALETVFITFWLSRQSLWARLKHAFG